MTPKKSLASWAAKLPAEIRPGVLTQQAMVLVFLTDTEYWEWVGWQRVREEAESRMLGDKHFPH